MCFSLLCFGLYRDLALLRGHCVTRRILVLRTSRRAKCFWVSLCVCVVVSLHVCFLVFLAALQGIPNELMEAAKMESKSKWGLFANIIFPMLTPTIVIVLLLRLAEAIKLFDIPFALTGGGPGVATQSMSFLAFRTGLRYFDLGYASAMSYCLLIIVMIIVTLFFRKLRQSYA